MAAGHSPAPTVQRRRGRRGWSRAPKKPRPPRTPSSPPPPPTREPAPLRPGAEVEVRIDDDGFHGTWFEATVVDFAPARGRGSPARYAVTYSHIVADDGGPLTEPFAPSRIRPRPPPPSESPPPRFLLHDIVEAFDRFGWWSGIVVDAADPAAAVRVAFPITREVIAFDPRFVRLRRDFVGGEWVPSRAVISVRPKRRVRVYEVGDNVEIVREHDVYGCSWFLATVAKVVDDFSYIVEYSDQEGEGGEKGTEYLHWKFMRPAVERSPEEHGFQLGPGAAVEAYCDGAWSPGVVRRVAREGEYEVSVNGKEAKQLVTKVVELLKPQYKWDGNCWSIVKPKRRAKLKQHSTSGKRPSSPVEVAFGNDEHSHDPEYSAIKKSRKELQQQDVVLAEGSEHAPVSEIDTQLSALCKSSASNHSPNSCSPLSGHSTLANESIPSIVEAAINQQIQSTMVLSENNEGKTYSMEARQGKNDASDNVQIQLNETSNITSKEIGCVLSASSECQTTSALTRQMSTGTNSGSNMKVYSSRKSALNKGLEGPQSSLDVTSTVQQRGRMKAAGRMKQPSLMLESPKSKPQQQLGRTSEDTLNIDEVTDKELLPMVPLGSESVYDEKGIDIRGSLLDEGLTATISSICQANRNATVLTGSAATQVTKSNCLMVMEAPTLSLDRLVQQDGGDVDERSILLHLQNAESSQCTIENSLLRSCSVAVSSMPSHLAHQVPFVKNSPGWHLVEAMDVFKEVPQRPHFLPLQKFPPELREEMALGLMMTFAGLVEGIRKSSIEDIMASFEEKINTLGRLEENGFNVQPVHRNLTKLFQIRSDITKHLEERDKLKAQILDRTTSFSRLNSLLDEKNTAIALCEKELGDLRWSAEQTAKEKEHEDAALSRLKADDSSVEEAYGDAVRQLHIVFAQLQRKRLT